MTAESLAHDFYRDCDVVAPALYEVTVTHERDERIQRAFTHQIYTWLVDVDDLPRLPLPLRGFARFRAADHFGDSGTTIRAKVDACLAGQGIDLSGGRVLMLAGAATLGYVFNPLSVFWCYAETGELRYLIAEVHNTYHQRHCYLLRPDEGGRASADKEFYVSPFLDNTGRYLMRFAPPGPRLSVTIALRQQGVTTLTARMAGTRIPASTRNVLKNVLRRPLLNQWVTTLIRAHGITLWLRGIPVRPREDHAATQRDTDSSTITEQQDHGSPRECVAEKDIR